MSRPFARGFRTADVWSDRATLAGLLIESLEPPPDPDGDDIWSVEAERRWQRSNRASSRARRQDQRRLNEVGAWLPQLGTDDAGQDPDVEDLLDCFGFICVHLRYLRMDGLSADDADVRR